MATITTVKEAKGGKYRAQIRRFEARALVYSEAKTFPKRTLAERWAAKREEELEQPGAIAHAKRGGMTLGALLRAYEEKYCAKAGRSKKADIKRLQGYEVASTPLSGLSAEVLEGCTYTIWASTPAVVWTAARPQELAIHVHVHDGQKRIIDDTSGEVVLHGKTLERTQLVEMMAERTII